MQLCRRTGTNRTRFGMSSPLSVYHTVHASAANFTKNNGPEKEQNTGPRKFHHLTVCMVPPESNELVWNEVTKCRTKLRDPGLFRWPPHANLLYPFVDIRPRDSHDEIIDSSVLEALVGACHDSVPFTVRLKQFGTFGGRKRGVLWLDPDCRNDKTNPLVDLQKKLVEVFPDCNDVNKKSEAGFSPHMTVSHFSSLEEALEAQRTVEPCWRNDLDFQVDRIYLLKRAGDDGQFLRVADIFFGKAAVVHDPPIPFCHMPATEADWVREERMKLKSRRRLGGNRGNRARHSGRGPRILDSPEVIAAKRAARKAKREASEVEAMKQQNG